MWSLLLFCSPGFKQTSNEIAFIFVFALGVNKCRKSHKDGGTTIGGHTERFNIKQS